MLAQYWSDGVQQTNKMVFFGHVIYPTLAQTQVHIQSITKTTVHKHFLWKWDAVCQC